MQEGKLKGEFLKKPTDVDIIGAMDVFQPIPEDLDVSFKFTNSVHSHIIAFRKLGPRMWTFKRHKTLWKGNRETQLWRPAHWKMAKVHSPIWDCRCQNASPNGWVTKGVETWLQYKRCCPRERLHRNDKTASTSSTFYYKAFEMNCKVCLTRPFKLSKMKRCYKDSQFLGEQVDENEVVDNCLESMIADLQEKNEYTCYANMEDKERRTELLKVLQEKVIKTQQQVAPSCPPNNSTGVTWINSRCWNVPRPWTAWWTRFTPTLPQPSLVKTIGSPPVRLPAKLAPRLCPMDHRWVPLFRLRPRNYLTVRNCPTSCGHRRPHRYQPRRTWSSWSMSIRNNS